MTEDRHMGVRDLRDQLGKRVDAAHFLGDTTVVEKNGEPRAVLVPYAWWLQVTEAAAGAGQETGQPR